MFSGSRARCWGLFLKLMLSWRGSLSAVILPAIQFQCAAFIHLLLLLSLTKSIQCSSKYISLVRTVSSNITDSVNILNPTEKCFKIPYWVLCILLVLLSLLLILRHNYDVSSDINDQLDLTKTCISHKQTWLIRKSTSQIQIQQVSATGTEFNLFICPELWSDAYTSILTGMWLTGILNEQWVCATPDPDSIWTEMIR